MDSWGTLNALTDDFKTYLDDNYTGNVPYDPIENNPLPLDAQDAMDQIAGIRISMYEEPEDILIRTGASQAKDWNQAYQMQLFLKVAREGDYDYIVEKELMAFKDKAYEWQDQLSPNSVASELFTFEWNNVSRITREAKFSEMTIDFGAYRSQL